ncbi:MAG: hypothetical protein WA655_12715 [Candidatus Korobacteraceae bacterium]
MKSILQTIITLAALAVAIPMFATDNVTDKVAIVIQSVKVTDAAVDIQMDIEGNAGWMFCFRTVPKCVIPARGRYWIAPVENGTYQDVVADVGLYSELSDPRKDGPVGVYGLNSPDNYELFSCPVTLSDVVSTSADVPYAAMSIENTTNRAVAEVKIRYSSIDRVGATTVGTRSFTIEQSIGPQQSIRFSTLNFGDEVVSHVKAANGIGVVYFVQDVKFADGTKWAMPPGVSWCRVMDENAKKSFNKK